MTLAAPTRWQFSCLAFPVGVQEFLGSAVTECLVAAAPGPGFDPASFRQARSEPTGCLHDGDMIDLGDRRLEVLHLPGHSPGSICLLDTDARILFTGDVVYAGGLIDEVWPGTDRMNYIRSMRRLAEVGVSIAFPGHGDPLTTEQFQQIIDGIYGAARWLVEFGCVRFLLWPLLS